MHSNLLMKISRLGEKKKRSVRVSRGEWSEREGLDSVSCVPSISHLDLHSCFRFNSAAMASYNAGKFVFYELFFF